MSRGTDLCQSFESCARRLPDGRVQSYWDALGGVWTIGWGSTGPDIGSQTVWDQAQCDARFEAQWNKAKAGVLRATRNLAKYPNRLEAVTDFAYNLGIGAYQTSTLKRYITQERWSDASKEFGKWDHAGGRVVAGLTRRRAAEASLFALPDGVVSSPIEASTGAQTVIVPPDSSSITFPAFLRSVRDLLLRSLG